MKRSVGIAHPQSINQIYCFRAMIKTTKQIKMAITNKIHEMIKNIIEDYFSKM